MNATLELRSSPGGLRHFIGDRPVHGGDIVELCFSGGWVAGRYEWDHDPTHPPSFFCSVELYGGAVAERSIAIPEMAVIRWPDSAASGAAGASG